MVLKEVVMFAIGKYEGSSHAGKTWKQTGGRGGPGKETGADAQDGGKVAPSQVEGKPGGEQTGDVGRTGPCSLRGSGSLLDATETTGIF